MRKAFPLLLLAFSLLYCTGAAALRHWLNQCLPEPVSWSYCLLAPVRYHEINTRLKAALPLPPPKPADTVVKPRSTADELADSVQASTRNRLDLVDNETEFFKAIETLLKAGDDDQILSDLALARRRAPSWFPARQTELTQMEISINARQNDLLALRNAASSYLNGAPERSDVMTLAAQRLFDEKFPAAALALLDEILRKTPSHVPARELRIKLALPASPLP